MSNKKGGLGGGSLEYTKVVPKFLQNLKKTTEVDINEKFKDYMNSDDTLEDQDKDQKDIIERAIKELEEKDQLNKDLIKQEQEDLKKAVEEERQKRIIEDQLEEEKARAEGRGLYYPNTKVIDNLLADIDTNTSKY
eukprot:gene2671-3314_t